MKESEILLENLIIHYYFSGPPEKNNPPIILLHGWGAESSLWKNFMEKLSLNGFISYALDFPGFGKSSLPPKNFGLKDFAAIVKSFSTRLGLSEIVLIGHSFGGRVAIKFASQNPTLIKKLVLIDSAGVRTNSSLKHASSFFAKLTKIFFLLPFLKPLKIFIYRLIGAEDYLSNPALKDIFSRVVEEDLRDLMPAIKQPALIVWGEKDEVTPLSFAKIMEERIQNSRLEILTGAGHYSFLDKPEEFAEKTINFLKS